MPEQKRKTFTVYLPTGDKFINADACRVHYEDDVVIFYNTDGRLMDPVAHFNLYNIYGWSECNV